MAPERLFLALPADGYRRCRLFFNISRETSMVHGRHRLPAGAGAYPSPRDLREARVPAGSRHLLGPELTRGAAEKSLKVSILNELRRSRGKGSPASSSPYFSGLRNVCLPQQDKVPFISQLGRFDRLRHPQIPLRRQELLLAKRHNCFILPVA